MEKLVKKAPLVALLLPVLLLLGGCPCGFDCDSDNDDDSPALLTLGFSDAALEDLAQVVIEVDSITFRRSGSEDVVVDTFTIDELNLVAEDTFKIDLLSYRGRRQLLVIENLELDTGAYSEVLIHFLDNDLNYSFVEESDNSLKLLNSPVSGLSLPGINLVSGDQAFTVEFSLAQALQYQAASGTYLLATDGVRVEDNATAASLSGRVDSSLFDSVSPCDAKTDPKKGNRIYLYPGIGLEQGSIGDVYTFDSTNVIPDTAVPPLAVAALAENTLTGGWDYAFGFLPAGDYTLAFSCNTADDHPVNYDGFVIPLPADQLYEINLSNSEQAVCDFTIGASCD